MVNDDKKLERSIGLTALILYGVGDILGTGIYGLVGKAAGEMGNAIWLAFLVSMIAAALTGFSYASLGSRYPKAGGAAHFTLKAYNQNWLSYIIGLSLLASAFTSMATAARAFSGYFMGVFPTVQAFVVVGFALFLCLVAFWGIKESMGVNIVFTLIELTGLLIIVYLGAEYLGKVDYLSAVTTKNPNGDITFSLLLSGAVLTFYSFIGFEDITNISEEVVNPKRNLPIGIILSLSIASVIYIAVSLVAVSVVPAMELAGSQEPLVAVVAKASPGFPTSIYSLISMMAVTNTALLNCIMASRLMYGMGNEGLLPKLVSKVHSKRKTPHVAILITFVIISILAMVGDISNLAKATSVLMLICFTVVNVALIVVKRNSKEPKGKFEIPYFIPVLGALVCASMLFSAGPNEWQIAGILLGIIVVLYFFLKPKNIKGN